MLAISRAFRPWLGVIGLALLVLTVAPGVRAQSFPYDAFKPAKLAQILADRKAENDRGRAAVKSASLYRVFDAADDRRKIRVVATGQVRAIPSGKADALQKFLFSMKTNKGPDFVTHEILVRDGVVEAWIPVETVLEKSLAEELHAGDVVDLYVIDGGSVGDDAHFDWIGFVEEFDILKPEKG